MSSFLEKISCIIVAGGIDDGCKVSSTVEVISKDFGNKKLPDIPQIIDGPSVLFQDGAVLLNTLSVIKGHQGCVISAEIFPKSRSARFHVRFTVSE